MELIVLDIDGILSLGEGYPFDLTLLQRLATLNQRSRHDKTIPAVTLNTGRPSPYVEAITQAISGWQPALFESGAGLYYPETNRFQVSPLMTEADRKTLKRVIEIIDVALVQTGKAYWQPGKTICHTLFANPSFTIDDIAQEVRTILTEHTNKVIAVSAIIALNIQPKHIDKGTGLEWLAETTRIEKSDIAGAGDSMADANFLKLIGYPAAPANATDEVKRVVKYVSPYPAASGLNDILDFWGV